MFWFKGLNKQRTNNKQTEQTTNKQTRLFLKSEQSLWILVRVALEAALSHRRHRGSYPKKKKKRSLQMKLTGEDDFNKRAAPLQEVTGQSRPCCAAEVQVGATLSPRPGRRTGPVVSSPPGPWCTLCTLPSLSQPGFSLIHPVETDTRTCCYFRVWSEVRQRW